MLLVIFAAYGLSWVIVELCLEVGLALHTTLIFSIIPGYYQTLPSRKAVFDQSYDGALLMTNVK
jgi:hypothetical protein